MFTFFLPGVLGYASNINTKDLLKQTNEERKKNGLPELTYNEKLSKAAGYKANDMFQNNYWAHISPKGIEPWYFFNQVDYDYSHAGENLAKNFNDSNSVVKAWMNSPTHKENILNPNYDEIGFAVVNGELQGYKTTLVVQFFGKNRHVAQSPGQSSGIESGKSLAVPVVTTPQQETLNNKLAINERPYVDVTGFSRGLVITLLVFLFILFILDFWYANSKGLIRITGNTFAHLIILIFAIVTLGIFIIPGSIG